MTGGTGPIIGGRVVLCCWRNYVRAGSAVRFPLTLPGVSRGGGLPRQELRRLNGLFGLLSIVTHNLPGSFCLFRKRFADLQPFGGPS